MSKQPENTFFHLFIYIHTIQHIIAVRKHSISVIHMLTYIRNQFLTKITAMTKSWLKLKKQLLFIV